MERREGAPPPQNVVVFIMESTRADAVTPYNPDLPSTPFLQEIAPASVLVERAYSLVPHTSKALVPILCGIEPRLSLEVVEARKGLAP